MFKLKARSSYGEGFRMNQYFRKNFDSEISLQFADLE